MSSARRTRAGQALAAVAALAALVLGAQAWFRQAGAQVAYPGDSVWSGLTRNLALAALAATAVTLVVGPVGRRLLALLLAALGAGMVWLGLAAPLPDAASDELPTQGAGTRLGTVTQTGMAYAYAAAGAVLVLAAAWLLLNPGRRRPRPATPSAAGVPRRPGEEWALMDRGIDPTEDL